ncbi:MAG TPA: hypothetical protein VF338_02990, partial [Leptolinea sp.]
MLHGEVRRNLLKISMVIISLLAICIYVPPISLQAKGLNGKLYSPGTPTASLFPEKFVPGVPVTKIQVSTDSVKSVAYSKDRKFLAVGYKNGVNIYDAQALTLIKLIDLSFSENTAVKLAFSPDSKMLAAITQHKESAESVTTTAYVWSLSDWSMLYSIEGGKGSITGLIWNTENNLVTLARDKTDDNGNAMFVYSLDGVLQASHESPQASSLSENSETEKLYIGSPDGFLYVYGSINSNFLKRVGYHSSRINSLALNQQNNLLVAGDDDGNLMVLNTDFEIPFLLKEKNVSYLSGISVSPDGTKTAYCTSKGNLAISNLQVLEPMQTLYSGTDKESCNETAFSPDGLSLTGSFTDGTMRVYQINSANLQLPESASSFNKVVSSTPSPVPADNTSLSSIPVQTLPILQKGAILSSNAGDIKILKKDFNLEDLLFSYQEKISYPVEFNGTTNNTWFAKDRTGSLRAEIVDGTIINVMDQNKQTRVSLAGNGLKLSILTFDPKEDTIAAGTNDGSVFIWNSLTGEKKCEIFTTPNKIRAIQFNHGGSVLAVSYGNMKLELFSVDNCNLLGKLPDTAKLVNQLTFSPNDQYL